MFGGKFKKRNGVFPKFCFYLGLLASMQTNQLCFEKPGIWRNCGNDMLAW